MLAGKELFVRSNSQPTDFTSPVKRWHRNSQNVHPPYLYYQNEYAVTSICACTHHHLYHCTPADKGGISFNHMTQQAVLLSRCKCPKLVSLSCHTRTSIRKTGSHFGTRNNGLNAQTDAKNARKLHQSLS